MMNKSFIKRLIKLNIIMSWDSLGFIISFFLIGYYTNWNIDFTNEGKPILDSFITVSSTFFAFILTGFTIITSFTDVDFILAWIKIGEYETVITLFEYNIYISMMLLIAAIVLRFLYYNSVVMIITISLFIYMVLSIVDLVKFIASYARQRGDFVAATSGKNR